ncbi:MAG: hypothetical protein WAU11_07540 [Ignavibacteriaceae bacterium]
MKKLNRILLVGFIFLTSITFNSCDPFDDVYLTLAMETELNTAGAGSDIFISSDLCLSDFDDYEDNKDNLEEIKYITSAYVTLNATSGLQGQNLTLTLYQANGSTILFRYIIPTFVAGSYVNNPLEIVLTQQEISNINAYLTNPKEDKCFVATLQVSNVSASTTPYTLNSKIDFLTELKIKP